MNSIKFIENCSGIQIFICICQYLTFCHFLFSFSHFLYPHPHMHFFSLLFETKLHILCSLVSTVYNMDIFIHDHNRYAISAIFLIKIFYSILNIFNLQLLPNTEYIPCVVQYILEPILYPIVCTSYSPILTSCLPAHTGNR